MCPYLKKKKEIWTWIKAHIEGKHCEETQGQADQVISLMYVKARNVRLASKHQKLDETRKRV